MADDEWITPPSDHPVAASADEWVTPPANHPVATADDQWLTPSTQEQQPSGWLERFGQTVRDNPVAFALGPAGLAYHGMGVAGQALLRGAGTGLTETAQLPTAFKDRPAPQQAQPSDDIGKLLNQPLSEGWSNPDWYIAHIAHGVGESAPSVAMGAAGTLIGAQMGGPWGAVGGGALGFGAGSALQTLVPAYQRARQPKDQGGLGLDHDQAVHQAIIESGIAGTFGAVMGLIPAGGQAAQSALRGSESRAAQMLAAPVSRALIEMGIAAPSVGAAQQTAEAASEGRTPTAGEYAQQYLENAGMGAAMHAGARMVEPRAPTTQTEPLQPGLAAGQRRPAETPTPENTAPDGAPAVNAVVGMRRGDDSEPERMTVLGYIDNGRGVQLQREDGSVTHEPTSALVRNLAAPPEAEDVTRTPPRHIEGEPISLEDFGKAFGEDTDTTSIRARAAGTTPERIRQADADQAARQATGDLPEMNLSALDMANRAERSAQELLRQGRNDEAASQMLAAQRWRELYGAGPGEFIGPEAAARASEARAQANTPNVLGQRTTPTNRAGATPEDAAAMEAQARAARTAGRPVTTELMGQRVGPAPPAPEFTSDELAFLRGLQGQRRPGQGAMELSGAAPSDGITLTPEEQRALAEYRSQKPQRLQGQGTFAGDLAAEMSGRAGAAPAAPAANPGGAAREPEPQEPQAQAEPEAKAQAAEPGISITAPPEFAPPAQPSPEPAAAPTPAEIPHNPVRGATERAFVPSSGEEFPIEFSVVDARDLVTSHHDDLSPNSAYPQALQPRSRERAETEAQLRSILNGGAGGEFRPELLGENPDAANGSPIIGPEGYVESGNARSMALRRAYAEGLPQAEEYKAFLASQSYPIEGIEQPVLVRINRAEMAMPQREQLARDLNAPPQAAMSASDQAMADARQVNPDLLRGYRGGDVFSVENQPFVRSVLTSIARPNDLPALTDPEGGLSRAGQQRVQAALLAKAYGDTGLVATLTEDADNNIKSVGNALTDAAPSWARMRDAVARGAVPEGYDLTSPILEAVRLIAHARDTGRNVAEFLRQRGLFGEDVSPETRSVLDWMLGGPDWTRRFGREKIADALTEYANSVQRPEGLPGMEARGEPLDMAERARQIAQGASSDLFTAPVEGTQGTGTVRPRLAEERGEIPGSESDRSGQGTPTGGATERAAQGEQRIPLGAEHETTEGVEQQRLGRQHEDNKEPEEWYDQIPLSDEQIAGMRRGSYDPELLNEFFEQFPQTPEGGNAAAQAWVVTRGVEDGKEHAVAVDPHSGEVVHVWNSGKHGEVIIPDELVNGVDPLNFHHNHPESYAPSYEDMLANSYPGIGRVFAHTHDGDTFSVGLSGRAQDWVAENDDRESTTAVFKDIYNAAARNVLRRMDAMVKGGQLNALDYDALKHDFILRALDAAGFVDYRSSRPTSIEPKVVRSILTNAGEAAAATARQYGLRLNYGDALNERLNSHSTAADRYDSGFDIFSQQGGNERGQKPVQEGDSADRAGGATPIRDAEGQAEFRMGGAESEGANLPDTSPGGVFLDKTARGIPGADETASRSREPTGAGRDTQYGGSALPAAESQENGQETVVGGKRSGPSLAEDRGIGDNGGPDFPERRPYVPPGTDYLDNVSHEIAGQTGQEGPGTYARNAMLPPREARTENGMRFNFVNQAFTTPMGLARRDWRSAVKWGAEEAQRNEASTLRNNYRQMLPTFLSATPDELAQVNKVREWRRLKGEVAPTDGRASMMVNDGSVPTALSNPGERVYLDNDRLTKIDQELTQTFQKAWDDVISATAKKFGWQGEPTSQALNEAIEKGGSTRERRQWTRTAALVSAMEEQRRAGYTPLMRFGDYYFAITPKAGTDAAKAVGWEGDGFAPVSNFQLMDSLSPWEKAKGGGFVEGQTPAQAQQRLNDLQKQFPTDQYNIEHGYLWAKENALSDLNIPAVEKLFVLVGNDVKQQIRDQAKVSPDPAMAKKTNQQTEDLFKQIRDGILDQMYKDITAGFKKQARNTPGYDQDMTRAGATYLNWVSSHVANLLHQDNIDNVNQNIIAKHPDPQVREYWKNWDERNDRTLTALDTGLRMARQASFYWALGANAATTAKILTHGPLLGVPTLSTGLGAGGRALAIGNYIKAMTQALSGIRADSQKGLNLDWRNMKGLTPDERTMLTNLENENRLHAQNADELRAIQQSGEDALSPQAKFNRRVLNVWASNVSVADQMTRAGMALAAYRTATRPGGLDAMTKTWGRDNLFKQVAQANGGKPTPTDVARFMVDRTTGVWGDANRMPFARGRAGATVMQFRNYEANYIQTLNQLMRGMGPEGRVSATMMLGGLFGMAGAAALPFAQDIYNLVTTISPDFGHEMDQAMAATGQNNTVAETVLHGMARNFLGIDMGQGLGFGDLISRQAEGGLNLAGPAAGIMGGDIYRAWQRANNGQPPEAWFNELMPNAVKNAVKAYVVEPEQGITAARSGMRVMTPRQITPAMKAETALGFQPAGVTRGYEKEGEVYRARTSRSNSVGALENRAATLETRALDMEQTDPQGAAALRAQFNAEIQAAVKAGTLPPDDLERFNRAVRQRVLGSISPDMRRLRELPKGERGQYLQQQPLPSQP